MYFEKETPVTEQRQSDLKRLISRDTVSKIPLPKVIYKPLPIKELIRLDLLKKSEDVSRKHDIKTNMERNLFSFKLIKPITQSPKEKIMILTTQTDLLVENRFAKSYNSHIEKEKELYLSPKIDRNNLKTFYRLYDYLLKVFSGLSIEPRDFYLSSSEKLILSEILIRKVKEHFIGR